MFRYILFTGLLIFVVSFLRTATADQLRIGVLIYPPYVVQSKTGEISGPLTEVVRNTLTSMGHVPEFLSLPFSRGVSWLRSGQIDAYFPLFRTPEREVFAVFPNEPIGEMVMALFSKSDLLGKYAGEFSDLSGMTVARVKNSLQSPEFEQAVRDKVLKETTVNDISLQFKMLAKGRVDLAIADRNAAKVEIGILDLPVDFVELEPLISVRPILFAISRNGKIPHSADEFSVATKNLRSFAK